MKFHPTSLAGCYVVEPIPMSDDRGWFARTFCKKEFAEIGHEGEWVQLNHSFTNSRGTVRGMHFQHAGHAEIKLVRCIAGAVWDVVVDIRKNSPTFLKYFAAEISAANRKMMYIPKGFAHGFQSLTNNAELIYHHSEFFTPAAEAGLRYNDPALGIEWPLEAQRVSQRDLSHAFIDNNFTGIE
jgi:dTDP-4-dehydrorhamnose 3,5-epimerase